MGAIARPEWRWGIERMGLDIPAPELEVGEDPSSGWPHAYQY